MMHSTMKQIATQNNYARPIFLVFHGTSKSSMTGLARKMKLKKSHYVLKFGGMMQFTMKQITVEIATLR